MVRDKTKLSKKILIENPLYFEAKAKRHKFSHLNRTARLCKHVTLEIKSGEAWSVFFRKSGANYHYKIFIGDFNSLR